MSGVEDGLSWLTPLVCPVAMFTTTDEYPHPGHSDEWALVVSDGAGFGLVTIQRRYANRCAYWWACGTVDSGVLHVLDTEVPPRADPLLIKGAQLWAEMVCEDPMGQWTVGNETIAVALESPTDAIGAAYGDPTPVASDLEFYATSTPEAITGGYRQTGCVHGDVEVAGRAMTTLTEATALRWHRWVPHGEAFGPVPVDRARAHVGLRVLAQLDDDVIDLVMTPSGWCRRDGN